MSFIPAEAGRSLMLESLFYFGSSTTAMATKRNPDFVVVVLKVSYSPGWP